MSICFSLIRRNTSIVVFLLNKASIREIAYYFIICSLTLSKTWTNNLVSLSPNINSIETFPYTRIIDSILNYRPRCIQVIILIKLFTSKPLSNLLPPSQFLFTKHVCRNARSSMDFIRELNPCIWSNYIRTFLNKSCQFCYP